jgi:hypothetical protein
MAPANEKLPNHYYARSVRQVCTLKKSKLENRAKKRRPYSLLQPRDEGGRWPGLRVERDGGRCYRGRGNSPQARKHERRRVEVREGPPSLEGLYA